VTSSDKRWKRNVTEVPRNVALSAILALRPVTYQWNEDAPGFVQGANASKLGFLAQDVHEAMPNKELREGLVYIDDEGYYGLLYAQMVALLTGAVQEQEATVKQQQAIIGKHEATIGEHEATIREHEATIGEHEATIGKHEATFELLETTIGEHEASIKDLEDAFGKLKETIDSIVKGPAQ